MLKIARAQVAKAAPIIEWVIPSAIVVTLVVGVGWVLLFR